MVTLVTMNSFILNNNSGVGAVDRTSILGALLREHEESNPPIKSNNRKHKTKKRVMRGGGGDDDMLAASMALGTTESPPVEFRLVAEETACQILAPEKVADADHDHGAHPNSH